MRAHHESKGRPAEKKLPVVVVYRKPSAKKYSLLVSESEIDDIILSTKRNPIIPSTCEIIDMGIGETFIETFKKQYNIK